MTDVAMWALVVGFVSATFVIPVLQRPTWKPGLRAAVTFAYSVLVGAGTVFFTGGMQPGALQNPRVMATTILLVLVTAISVYKGFAQPTGIAPAIEHATSPGPTAVD